MDFLNKAFVQIRDLFLSMTPGARITAGLLLAVVVVSLAYLFHYQATGPDAYLMGSKPFEPRVLHAIEGALGKAGLSYELEGARIRIPRGQQHIYMAALADAGALPPSFGSYFQKAISTSSPFDSKDDKLFTKKVAQQDELAMTIRHMRGIEKAFVYYDEKKSKRLAADDIATASVSIQPMLGHQVDDQQVRSIRWMVSQSIAGMKPENVTVVDLESNRSYFGSDEDGSGGDMGSSYFSRTARYEKEREKKIRELLQYLDGVVVQVSAELTPEIVHHEESVNHDPTKVADIHTRKKTISNKTESGVPGGQPGPAAQANNSAVLPAATTAEVQDETEQERQSLVSTQRSVRELQGMTPKRVTASIAVPSDYYVKVWQEQNPTAEGEEPQDPDPAELADIETKVKGKIQTAVAKLLPQPADNTDPIDLVTVTTVQSLTRPPMEDPSLAQNTLAWTGRNWSTLTLVGFAAFSLVMLRSMIKSVPGGEPLAPAPGEGLSVVGAGEDDEGSEGEQAAARLFARPSATGPSMKDELSEIVREDPDAAATILRSWISNAG